MKKNRGFTLIELVAVLSILFLVVWLMMSAYLAGFWVFQDEKNTSDILSDANAAMEIMTKELRNAREIEAAAPTNVTYWWKDLDSDSTKEASEIVTYSWNGTIDGNLVRTISGVSQTISKYVKNFSLTYDSGTLSSIKKIMVHLTTGLDGSLETLEATVVLRNLQ